MLGPKQVLLIIFGTKMLMSADVAKFFHGIYGIEEIYTDNIIFKLHYRLTCVLLLAFSAIISTNQMFGAPIKCTFNGGPTSWLPPDYLDNYCWIHPKQTIPAAYNKRVGVQVAYPGIDNGTPPETERISHNYYQWVAFVLFLQATSFYFPRFLWRVFEGDKIKKILSGLNKPILNVEERNTSVRQLAIYLSDSVGHHGAYGGVHVTCELLNLLNVVGQIFVTDAFLSGSGQFLTYGIDVVRHARDPFNATVTGPMDRMFPKDVKCLFFSYGASGSVATRDGLCILPVNIINEKIFLFLFFYYIVLACCSSLALGCRLCLLHCRKLRWKVLAMNNHCADTDILQKLVRSLGYSDWFVMYLLCKNMAVLHYAELVHTLDESLYPEKPAKKCP